MDCSNCEAVYINGVLCHEQGCPDAWRTGTRECIWCGQDFIPEFKGQICCCADYLEAYDN